MKKLFFCILLVLLFTFSCGNQPENKTIQSITFTPTTPTTTITTVPSFTATPTPSTIPTPTPVIYLSNGFIQEYEVKNQKMIFKRLITDLPPSWFIDCHVDEEAKVDDNGIKYWYGSIYPQMYESGMFREMSLTQDICSVFAEQYQSDTSSVFRLYMNNEPVKYKLYPFITSGVVNFRFEFQIDEKLYNADGTNILRIEVGFQDDIKKLEG